jgi:chemotaxis protein MotA
MSIEGDIEKPDDSPLFSKYASVVHDHHLMEFVCDYLRLMVSGNMDAFQIENLMDNELETHHHEAAVPAHFIAKLGDGLPAFGIVAAVMGVVHTMESVGIPPAELGILIAHALVGTFLGILLAYGFIGPLASLIEQQNEESAKAFQCKSHFAGKFKWVRTGTCRRVWSESTVFNRASIFPRVGRAHQAV